MSILIKFLLLLLSLKKSLYFLHFSPSALGELWKEERKEREKIQGVPKGKNQLKVKIMLLSNLHRRPSQSSSSYPLRSLLERVKEAHRPFFVFPSLLLLSRVMFFAMMGIFFYQVFYFILYSFIY
jgi:hypothetical protein